MMWPYSGGGSGWVWMGFAMLLVWSAVIGFVIICVRALAGPRTANSDAALETLRQRLASGQISAEEFEKTRQMLQRA